MSRLIAGIGTLAIASSALGQWQATYMHEPVLVRSEIRAIAPDAQYGKSSYDGHIRATAWSGISSSWSIYNPGSAFTSAQINAAAGSTQAGVLNGYATVWHGGPAAPINLHPFAFGNEGSEILAIDGVQQAGKVYMPNTFRENAFVWSGTAESAVNLHPQGADWSVANGVGGGQQSGYYWQSAGGGYRAALWSGTAASMTLLHPEGAAESQARGMVSGQQVGWYRGVGQNSRAALWSGSAQSLIDMHPLQAGTSELLATCGSAQVGWASTVDGFVAGIWFGSAESFVSLGSLLPPGYISSTATCVAERNGVYYVGGYALGNGGNEAWMWVGVPAPGTASLLIGAGLFAARRRRA